MGSLRIAVCEDCPEEREELLGVLDRSAIPSETDVYSCGEALLRDHRPESHDLILMDIYLGGISGVETVERLRAQGDHVPVAFITVSLEHTLESYRLEAIKYIEKPVKAQAVWELMEYALFKKEQTPRLSVKKNGREVSVPFSQILYAEQQDHTLHLYLAGGGQMEFYGRLDSVEPRFAGQPFLRCHKSYLVNLAYVAELDRELMVFVLKDGQRVHIRRESLGRARKAFAGYLFAAARQGV